MQNADANAANPRHAGNLYQTTRTSRYQGLWCQVFRCQVSGTKLLYLSPWYQVFGTKYFGTRYLVPKNQCQIPRCGSLGTQYQALCIKLSLASTLYQILEYVVPRVWYHTLYNPTCNLTNAGNITQIVKPLGFLTSQDGRLLYAPRLYSSYSIGLCF